MLRSEAITIIKRGLGFRQTQDQAIVAALQSAQRTLEKGKTLPTWLGAGASLPVVAGNESVALPVGFLRFFEDELPYYLNSDNKRILLSVKRYDEAFDAYGNITPTTGSYPKVIVMITKSLASLLPTPGVSFGLIVNYYRAADVLDSDIANKWLDNAPDYIIGEAGMQIAMQLRDKDALSGFTAMRDRGRAAQLGDTIEDELAGRPLIMGRDN